MECRFAKFAEVENASGEIQRMIHCLRLDCDNWDMVDAENAKGIRYDDEDAA